MRIFYIAEITGKVGVWAVKKHIAFIRRTYQPDFIIANADKATGAGGLGKQHAGYLKKMGIDCLIGSDCIFQKKDLVEALPNLPFVLRPCNLSPYSPGRGYRYFFTRRGEKLAVMSLLGRVGQHRLLADNPFAVMQSALSEIQKETRVIVADFSALATAEKQAMAFFLAGKVSALIGSGTGAATADAQLMAAGYTAPFLSMSEYASEGAAASCQGSALHDVGARGNMPTVTSGTDMSGSDFTSTVSSAANPAVANPHAAGCRYFDTQLAGIGDESMQFSGMREKGGHALSGQTADAQAASHTQHSGIPSVRKTAYITDAGRTGSFDSVGGHAPSSKIREYRTGLFEYPQETWQRVCIQGVDIELDGSGSARSIERVRIELPQEKH